MDRRLSKNIAVLIIDDHVLAQGYMKYSLQELGFESITYMEHAEKAFNHIRDNHFDLILCSYHLKREQEGYHLYERLIENKLLSPATTFIFISAETTVDIVRSIVELQPDDFLVKPFTVVELDKRLSKVLTRKTALKKIYTLMHDDMHEQALDQLDEFLTNPKQSEHFPQALKLKGELILDCQRPGDARDFYQAILNVQHFHWAQLGLVKALFQLGENEEAEKLLLRLAIRPESQLQAFDILSDYHIQQEDFDIALESTILAAEVSPRNLNRHRLAVDLSRITHDYQTQFEVTKNIVRYARNSIYDQPDIYLNAARAGIDYAIASNEEDVKELMSQSNDYLKRFSKQFPKAQLKEQLNVINARMHFVNDDIAQAQALLEKINDMDMLNDSMEDLLDKAKAFHEIGLYEKSIHVLDEIERRCTHQPMQGKIFLRYIEQEKQERIAIKASPKELNNIAVDHYRRGDISSALKTFRQAYRIMPKSPSIALNLLQAIAMKSKNAGLPESARTVMNNCLYTIENSKLTEEQQQRYERVREHITDLQ
ncbi:response regulator [Alteromonadaceae bacterium BrNp21-10]|nr:response regulator [Alteromonadaceae bacterium BrNp21-10]